MGPSEKTSGPSWLNIEVSVFEANLLSARSNRPRGGWVGTLSCLRVFPPTDRGSWQHGGHRWL